jgi:flap endonuclease-1
LSKLAGKTIVIDASIYLYKYSAHAKNPLLKNLTFMLGLFELYRIQPVFVFDGRPPPEKRALLETRRLDKEKAIRDYQDALANKDEDKKQELEVLRRDSVTISRDVIKQVKEWLQAKNVQCITAQGEADEVCARMVIEGEAWAVLSEDMDMFVYGCPRVLRYFSLIKHSVVCYSMREILEELGMTQNEFREICVLAGTDYNQEERIVTADLQETMKLFREYKNTGTQCDTFYEWLHGKNMFGYDCERLYRLIGMFQVI